MENLAHTFLLFKPKSQMGKQGRKSQKGQSTGVNGKEATNASLTAVPEERQGGKEIVRNVAEEKAMRRAVYSEARKKDIGSTRSSFVRLAALVKESVGDVREKKRITSMFMSMEKKTLEKALTGEQLSIGEWSELANSLLGAFDAIFDQMERAVDPNFEKVFYKTLQETIVNVQATDRELARLDKIAYQCELGMYELQKQLLESEFLCRTLLGNISSDLEAMKAAIALNMRGEAAEGVMGVLNVLPLGQCRSRYQEIREQHTQGWKYVAPEHLKDPDKKQKEKEWCWTCWNFDCRCVKESDGSMHETEVREEAHENELATQDNAQGSLHRRRFRQGSAEGIDEAQGSGEEIDPSANGGNDGCNPTDISSPVAGSQGPSAAEDKIVDVFKKKTLLGKIADLRTRLASSRYREDSRKNPHASEEKQSVLAHKDTAHEVTPDDKGQDSSHGSANVSHAKDRSGHKAAPSQSLDERGRGHKTAHHAEQDRHGVNESGRVVDDAHGGSLHNAGNLDADADTDNDNHQILGSDDDPDVWLEKKVSNDEPVAGLDKHKVPGAARAGTRNSDVRGRKQKTNIAESQKAFAFSSQHYRPLVPARCPDIHLMTPKTMHCLSARRRRVSHLGDVMELERSAMSHSLASDCFVHKFFNGQWVRVKR